MAAAPAIPTTPPKKIKAQLEAKARVSVELFDICKVHTDALLQYDCIIIGCSTWYIGEMQDDWAAHLKQYLRLDFGGRRMAFFGAGDQQGYPDTFQDAIGYLAKNA